LLIAITVALPAVAGLAVPAAAAPIQTDTEGLTPEFFEFACFEGGGQPFEILDSNGGVASSVCENADGTVSECNWGQGTCDWNQPGRVQPTPSGPLDDVSVDPDDLGGILDEGTSPPVATEPASEETDESATEPATEETDEDAPTQEATTIDATPVTDPAGNTGSTGNTGGSAAGAQSGQSASGQESASLTIVAFTCEPGYDPFALDADPAQDCSEPTDGVPFALTGDGTDMTRSAGDDGSGTATFQDVAPGVYRLAGQPPSWGGVAFVHDCVSSVRSFDDAAFFPLAMVGPTGTLGLTLLPGETLECGWYQVAAGD
jgi:hypothetical protein